MAHLALGDQFAHGAGDVFDRHRRVDPVLVEQIDRLDAEAAERGIRHFANVRRSRIGARHRGALDAETELRRDDDLVTHGRNRFADEPLVVEGAVDLGRVDEGDASIDSVPQHADHVGAVSGVRAIAHRHAHGAEPDGRHREAPPGAESLAENARVHHASPVVSRGKDKAEWVMRGPFVRPSNVSPVNASRRARDSARRAR